MLFLLSLFSFIYYSKLAKLSVIYPWSFTYYSSLAKSWKSIHFFIVLMTWDRPASSRCFLLPCVFFSPRRTVGMSVSTVSGSMPFHTRPYAICHLSSVSLTDLVVSLTCSIANIIDYRNSWCLSQHAWVQKRDSSLHLQISLLWIQSTS